MELTIVESFSGLGAFFGYFAASAVLLVLFCVVYLRVTPMRSWVWSRRGRPRRP